LTHIAHNRVAQRLHSKVLLRIRLRIRAVKLGPGKLHLGIGLRHGYARFSIAAVRKKCPWFVLTGEN